MTPPSFAPPARSVFFRRHWTWWLMVATLAIVTLVRLRLLDFPLERDEGEYAYAGQLMLQGVPPYELAYNMKFPGTYAAYAVIMKLFGETPAGIHFGVLCVTLLTAVILYRLGRRLLDETAGAVAASAYAVMAASPTALGLEGHATHFVALFAAAGLWCLLPVGQTVRWPRGFAGGFLLSTATLMIQHAAFFCLWGLVLAAATGRRPSEPGRAGRWPLLVAYGSGAALPLGLTGLALWHAGVIGRFGFWAVEYARQYVSIVPLAEVPMRFADGFSHAVGANVLLWIIAVIGLRLLWLDQRMRETRFALVGFTVASLLAACPGFYFRPHYFLLTLPAVALLAGGAVSAVRRHFSPAANAPGREARLALALVLVLVAGLLPNWKIWFVLTPAQASRAVYGFDLYAQAEAAAAVIRTNTAPDARLAVLGSEPEIYFLSRRHSATGYIYTYALMEPQPFARRMQQEMIQEIETAKPPCVAAVTFNDSWITGPESDHEIFDWWESYRKNYDLVRSFPINGAPAGSEIMIYQRKRPALPAEPGPPHD